MTKESILTLLLCLIGLPAMAQQIRGQVVNQHGEGIAYANVALLVKQNSAFVVGVMTAEDGNFALPYAISTPIEKLTVKVSCMGFESAMLNAVADMGAIMLKERVKELGEVTVTGKRPVFKMSKGKLTVTVQHTILANTGNAIQVLSLLPFMSRTEQGVSVFGRGTPIIYVDNRKLQDTGELQKLASDEIKSIETDLHPGIAYGSEVKAVIKIITKRKSEGLSANLTAQGLQTKHFNDLAFGKLNYRKGKWDFFGGVSFRHTRKERPTDNTLTFEDGNDRIDISQTLDNNSKSNNISANIGLNFSNNNKNDFGVRYMFSRVPKSKDALNGNNVFMKNLATEHTETIMLLGNGTRTTHNLNMYYITSWGKDNTLNLNLDYMNGQALAEYNSFVGLQQNVLSQNHSRFQLYAARAEASNPL